MAGPSAARSRWSTTPGNRSRSTPPSGLLVAPVGTPLTPDLEGFKPIGHLANPATIRPRLDDLLTDVLRDAGLSLTVKTSREIPADELLSGIHDPTLTIRPSARSHTVTFTVPKVKRRTLRLLFGDAVPRSARSQGRRRANLRRKRQMRKKHR